MEHKIYSVKNYSKMSAKYFENYVSKSKNVKEIVELCKTDKSYHFRLIDGETYIFYIDLDGYLYDIEKFNTDLKNFLKLRYDINIDIDDIKYTENNEKKGSYHISIPCINAITTKQKEMIENLKNYLNFVDATTKKIIDTTVYTDKWFRLPNQTKGDNSKGIHIIKRGSYEDFILNYIPKESKNINEAKYILTKEEEAKDVKKEKKEKKEKKIESERKPEKTTTEEKECDLEKIEKLLNILDSSYYDDFNLWIKIMFILKKYQKNTKKNTFELFINFSKKSKKFNYDECSQKWNSLKDDYDIKCNLGSLYFFAKSCNMTEYKNILQSYHKKTHIDITEKYLANKIKELAGHLFFYKNLNLYCYDTNINFWYENRPEILKKYINDDLYDYVLHLITDAINDNDYFNNQRSILRNLCLTNKGQEKIVKTFGDRFFNEVNDEIDNIEFDSNYLLYGFQNGVYDFKTQEFRKYRYDDYLTIHCGYNYQEAKKEDVKYLNEIFDKIEKKKENKKLLFQILGTGLLGKSPQKFIIFSGKGGNGKSTISGLMEKLLGNYFYKGDINTLCEESTSNASPAIANMHNKRYVVFSEPSENKKINNGKMKSFTGDSYINARLLFSNNTKIKMVCTMIVECNLKIYLKDEATEGEIRRIIDYGFKSKFTENEDEIDETNNVYKADKKYISEEFFIKYKYAFFKILCDYVKEYLDNEENLEIPEEIKNNSNEYISKSYFLLNILKDVAKKTDSKDDFIKIDDFFDLVKENDIYVNLTKDEKRKFNKKYIVEFFENNKYTSKNFFERKNINNTYHRNILVGFKFLDE